MLFEHIDLLDDNSSARKTNSSGSKMEKLLTSEIHVRKGVGRGAMMAVTAY